jgi:scyllo-inositol 2-dehydrogenase (NAD+)
MVGSEGAIMVDDSHRDVSINTMKRGIEFPLSTMPGEKVEHVYAGPMEAETIHFLDCVARGKQPLVTPEHARMVMQVYQAADQSAEENRPIDIAWPAPEFRPAREADFVGARTPAPARIQK